MFIQMLKNQNTFYSNAKQAMKHNQNLSMVVHEPSGQFVISHTQRGFLASVVDIDEAEACVLFHANNEVSWNLRVA